MLCDFQMSGVARSISSNLFYSAPTWVVSNFLLPRPLQGFLKKIVQWILTFPLCFLEFVRAVQGSLIFLRAPQGSLGFLVFLRVTKSSSRILRIPLGSLGFIRVSQTFLGFPGLLRVFESSLGLLRVPGIMGLNGIQSCFSLILRKIQIYLNHVNCD